jgi:alkylhydroperoxidase/carboxymuconolactone decarboxylase family protein YurZ
MSDACLSAGPLDQKTTLLIRIGIAAAAKKRTPLATHIRTALDEGISEEEIEHAIILTASTEGFSTMVQAYREWLSVKNS